MILKKENWLRVMKITLIILCFAVKIVYSDAPFNLTIEPEEQEVNVGDEVTYYISVVAEEGFNESIKFDLEVSALAWNTVFDLGVLEPPYPFEFNYTFTIPEEIPIGVTGTAIVTGYSGDYRVEKMVTLTIKKPSSFNIPGFPIESIILGGASLILILWITKRTKPTIIT